MAPGPRKKGSYKRGSADNNQDYRNDRRTNETQSAQINKNETPFDANDSEDKKYTKRSVKSNWNRYEELPNDPLADKMRGNDFEVILSYSGGSGSQLQLQDEKDWDDVVDDKSITLDLKDLIQAMKCIPFHERIHLAKNIFDERQISKFVSNAEFCQKSYKSNLESPLEDEPENLESHLNIIENPEACSDSEEIFAKPQAIEDKTQNLIESLTSSLLLKSQMKDKNQTVKATIEADSKESESVNSILFSKPQRKEKEQPVTTIENASKEDDELDFLLSLNISLNESRPAVNDPQSAVKSSVDKPKLAAPKVINVDDWLNNLLD